MYIEMNEIPQADVETDIEDKKKEGLSGGVIDVLLKQLLDALGILTGVGVTIQKPSELKIDRKRILWWTQLKRQLGYFGPYPPPVVLDREQDGYDICFTTAIAPLFPPTLLNGGALGMVVWQSDAFDLITGVYIKYGNPEGPFLRTPYVVGKLGEKGSYAKMSSDDLWTILKSEGSQSGVSSTLASYRLDGQVGYKGKGQYHFAYTVTSSKEK